MEQTQRYWIGFDLGGTKMLSVVYNDRMEPLGRKRRKTKGVEGSEAGVDRIVDTIRRTISEANLDPTLLAGIGIGCPGPVDPDSGEILTAPNLGWKDLRIGPLLSGQFKCPVAVLNDVDAGVYGEYRFGAAVESRCVVGIFPGTGVGGGCVYRGEILQGAGISCMEIGHMRISSGRRTSGHGMAGTLESEASRLAIAAECAKAAYRGEAPTLLKEAGTDIAEIRSGALAHSVEQDPAVRKIVEQAAEMIGMATANLVHLLAPDRIVLGGGLVEAMPSLFINFVTKTARQAVMPPYKNRFEVVSAKLADDAGVMGAAAWIKHRVDGT